MIATASQITSLTIVYSTVYSGADQRKHQSSVSVAFVRGIHRWSVNSPYEGPITRKMFLFDDVIMPMLNGAVGMMAGQNVCKGICDHYRWSWVRSSSVLNISATIPLCHDDVIKWKDFPCNWPFVWGIHRSPVNSPHKGQWRGVLMFSLICAITLIMTSL